MDPGTRRDDGLPGGDCNVAADDPDCCEVLASGEVEVLGRMPWSSNGTFLATVAVGSRRARAIYKPEAGERPLWDFPNGLWRREVASFELSRLLGYDVVPPTVARADAPLGPGSLQYFVTARFEEHYFTIREDTRHLPRLRAICVLDIVSNNTDRKAGHCLLGTDGLVWAIDNGLSFHAEFKLRTVIWDFAGEPVDRGLLRPLEELVAGVPTELAERLDPFEVDALRSRADALLHSGVFPADASGRRIPWPLV